MAVCVNVEGSSFSITWKMGCRLVVGDKKTAADTHTTRLALRIPQRDSIETGNNNKMNAYTMFRLGVIFVEGRRSVHKKKTLVVPANSYIFWTSEEVFMNVFISMYGK